MSNAFKLRLIITVLCLVLPSLSLLPFGALWLIERGYVWYWVAGAFFFVVIAFLLQLYLFKQIKPKPQPAGGATLHTPEDEASAGWSPREKEAWARVLAVADGIELEGLDTWGGLFALGQRTVEAVASAIHPEEKEPLWNFTAPEALTLFERVSQNLRPMIYANIPLGDQLTIGQILRIYRWRTAIDWAQRGYDVWRIVRLLNPATAVTQELRERMSRQMYHWGREEIARRLARGYVKEVGRAAIDLYGGRLRVSEEVLAAELSKASARDKAKAFAAPPAEPLRVLVAGQVNAGKSSLISALLGVALGAPDIVPSAQGFAAHAVKLEGEIDSLVIDSPGISDDPEVLKALEEEAAQSDFLIWVLSAVRADRGADLAGLKRVRDFYAKFPHRRPPAILAVLTHVDQLRPFQDWAPPYALTDPKSLKAMSIKRVVEVVAAELGFAIDEVVPVCANSARGFYNIEAVNAKMRAKLPEADGARFSRILTEARRDFNWKQLGGQALNASRYLARTLWRRK